MEEQSFVAYPEDSITEGIIISEPERRFNNQHIVVESKEARILLFTNRYQEFAYGDYVIIKGEVKEPENFGTFDYQSYLLRQGIRGVSYYPNITVLEQGRGSSFLASLYDLKDRMREPIQAYLPEPHGALLLAMTLGDDWRIPPDFREALARSGTAHIAAISGLHMTIIIGVAFLLFILVGFSRPWATLATTILISFYILLVGFPASAIRAGIMGMLVLVGYLLGRLNKLFYALLLAALLILLWDIRWAYDAGFQLSFGAMTGLALLYQPLRTQFYRIPRIEEHKMLDLFIVSLAITLVISPILFYHFGRISLVAPIANVVILPVMPFTMILGFLTELTGFSVFVLPLWLLLEYQVRLISLFGII